MAKHLPNLNLLQAFEAAARHSSFIAAAKELSLSSGVISQHIKMLENSLGFLLFERLPRRVFLTRMGASYLPSVQKLLDDISETTTELFGISGDSSSIKLRAPMSFSVISLAPRLARFIQEYPNIEVKLSSSLWPDEVEAQSYDLDIRFGTGNWPEYDSDLLLHEGFTPVCSPKLYPMPCDLAQMPKGKIISVTGSESTWLNAMRTTATKTANPSHVIWADNYLIAAQLGVLGMGALILPKSIAERYINSGQLIRVDTDFPMNGAHYLLRKGNHGRSKPEIAILQQWLVNDYQKDGAAD